MSTYAPSRMGSPGMGLGSGGGSAMNASANTTLLRRLVWEGSVPVEIRINPSQLPAESDRGLESYFLQVPRIAYLPFIISDIRAHLAELVLNEREVQNIKEENWWFEDEFKGVIKWHWPIGLLYDLYVSSKTVSMAATQSTMLGQTYPQPVYPLRMILHLAAPPPDKIFQNMTSETCKQAFMGQIKEADFLRWGSTKRVTGLRKAEQDGMWEALKDHNFDEFWRVAAKITPTPAPVGSPGGPPSSFQNTQSTYSTYSNSSGHSRPPSTDPNSMPLADRDSATSVRSIPIRIFLPDLPSASAAAHAIDSLSPPSQGSATSPPSLFATLPATATTSTILQPLIPPLIEQAPSTSQLSANATPQTQPQSIRTLLETHLPLLWPRVPATPLAHAIVHGIAIPEDTELAWLGACMAGPDGWLSIIIALGRP